MANLKSLAKDTAIYGLSSIVGRFLNYLLVPLYTAKLSAASGGYGIITNVYAYTALLMVILTYGMETTFFRFANKEGEDPQKVYSTTLMSVGFTSLLFVVLVLYVHLYAVRANLHGFFKGSQGVFRCKIGSTAVCNDLWCHKFSPLSVLPHTFTPRRCHTANSAGALAQVRSSPSEAMTFLYQ